MPTNDEYGMKVNVTKQPAEGKVELGHGLVGNAEGWLDQ